MQITEALPLPAHVHCTVNLVLHPGGAAPNYLNYVVWNTILWLNNWHNYGKRDCAPIWASRFEINWSAGKIKSPQVSGQVLTSILDCGPAGQDHFLKGSHNLKYQNVKFVNSYVLNKNRVNTKRNNKEHCRTACSVSENMKICSFKLEKVRIWLKNKGAPQLERGPQFARIQYTYLFGLMQSLE